MNSTKLLFWQDYKLKYFNSSGLFGYYNENGCISKNDRIFFKKYLISIIHEISWRQADSLEEAIRMIETVARVNGKIIISENARNLI